MSGNRVAAGRGNFPRWQVLTFAVEAPVRWLVALPSGQLAGADQSGTLLVWEITGGALRLVARYGDVTSGEAPPAVVALGRDRSALVIVARDGRLALLADGTLRSYDVGTPLSRLSAPVPVTRAGREWDDVLAVAADGAVVLVGALPAAPRVIARADVRALPDARITVADLDGDGAREAVVLTDPIERSVPGLIGGRLEPTAVTVLELLPHGLALKGRLALPPPAIFEDRVPVLAPLEAGGRAAIVLARSTPERGATLVVLGWRDGGLGVLAEGPAGQRWVNVLAVGDLSGHVAPEVAAVRAPHQGGILSAFSRRGGQLVAIANAAGYSTHMPGSRNQDQGLLADLDGNGRLEAVVPRQGHQAVVGLEIVGSRFVERWSAELRSPLQSNLVAADLDGDGLLDLALADRGTLHVFLSVR